jgi:5-(carboxyamino)imidazole ribonucleotide synthase
VIVARGVAGETATFPVCENLHRDHILDITVVPARVSPAVEKSAAELARAIAEKMDLVGLLAVEMFLQRDGNLVVNELAPRPHNSGHWTIEGCATSQFEQHVRAVCGLALGSTEILRPSAMANLLGDLWRDGEPNWAEALEVGGVHLHLYGKRDPRLRRKMGHLTALAENAEAAIDAVSTARQALHRRTP